MVKRMGNQWLDRYDLAVRISICTAFFVGIHDLGQLLMVGKGRGYGTWRSKDLWDWRNY